MRCRGFWLPALLTVAMCAAVDVSAGVRLAGFFSDHMVLQRDAKLPIWGWAAPGEAVTVKLATHSATTTAATYGRWRIAIDALPASETPVELTVSSTNTITVHDVLIGDVWLAAGQSNMQFALKGSHNADADVALADHPTIRLCMIGMKASLEPEEDRSAAWVVCTPETAKKFSAVAYFFGRDLQAATRAPVGLIGTYVSGTPAQSWASVEALQSSPQLKHYLDERAEVRLRSTTNPSALNAGVPASLFNAMVAPLIPFSLKGIIWYQGESNVKDYAEYRALFPALISGWRAKWRRADLPFLFVQLPGNGRRGGEPSASNWAMLREAQAGALSLPSTAMAVTLDLVPARALLHPKNKSGIGRRLADAALAVAYRQDVEYRSPSLDGMRIDGGRAHIRFKNAAGGMKIGIPPQEEVQPSTTYPTKVAGFTIAGADRKFAPADATIEGDEVVVWSDRVPSPVAVRYGWADNPEVNLYNAAKLPAAPFRTDNWPE